MVLHKDFLKKASKVIILYRIRNSRTLAYLDNYATFYRNQCKQHEYGENLKPNIYTTNAKVTD